MQIISTVRVICLIWYYGWRAS